MSEVKITFPERFDENEWEIEAKGYLLGVIVHHDGISYELNFYDPVRLQQDASVEIDLYHVFTVMNLVVIESLTRDQIEKAASVLADSGKLLHFSPIAE